MFSTPMLKSQKYISIVDQRSNRNNSGLEIKYRDEKTGKTSPWVIMYFMKMINISIFNQTR